MMGPLLLSDAVKGVALCAQALSSVNKNNKRAIEAFTVWAPPR
jgi:hypothetical protein